MESDFSVFMFCNNIFQLSKVMQIFRRFSVESFSIAKNSIAMHRTIVPSI